MLAEAAARFRTLVRDVDFWSLRLVSTRVEGLSVRQDVVQPALNQRSAGAMIQVAHAGGAGYSATSDLSDQGLEVALGRARDWAHATRNDAPAAAAELARPEDSGHYRTPVAQSWDSWGLKQRLELLRHCCRSLHISPRIVDWEASLAHRTQSVFLTTSDGVEIEQEFSFLFPGLRAAANEDTRTQTRTHGSGELACQGGLEQLERVGFTGEAGRVAQQALELLAARECPASRMDLLLMPTQMVLQIHESIGHPLELDRILGDERNYAGTSFVEPAMFGRYRYGSQLLNVTFDPTEAQELAACGYDDEGGRAERQTIIREGILERPLGGFSSRQRGNLPGVASARACSWNRPPIDRIGNLNVEPGESTLEEMIAATEYGVMMDTNRSWSIDDSRNKFQFGCEYARMIRDGKLAEVVRNPNYRGVSATFWRSLKMVGDPETWMISGTPYCGKGEPNQMIHVGHATPACLFADVEVFGGD